MEFTLSATPEERVALAERLDLVALNRLEATVRLRRLSKGRGAELDGTLSADVVQSCVVTLEPVPAVVTDRFRVRYVPDMDIAGQRPGGEIDVGYDEDDAEPLEGGAVDMGETVAQHLSLALDPYPRSPGAALPEDVAEEPLPEPAKPNPFIVLKQKG